MTGHHQYDDDLALLALEALEGDERTRLEQHLDGCAECREELARLRGDMALLALSASGPKPPARSRQRLLTAVSREPRNTAARGRRRWWLVPAFALIVLLAAAAWLSERNEQLRRQLSAVQQQFADQQAQLEQAREIVATLTDRSAQQVTLVAAKAPPQPQGKAIYVRDRGSLIFIASNFRPLSAQKVYELWLIPKAGSPIPAGVFKPDAHGGASVIHPPLPPGVEAKAFAITVEPEGGSAAPTSPPILLGAGE